MFIVVLGSKDPNDVSNWSGIPHSLVRGLRQCGHHVTTIGPLTKLRDCWKEAWYRRIPGKTYLAIRDPDVARTRAAKANELLRGREHIDLVITLHPSDAAYLRCRAPILLIHDVTWHLLLDFYPFYRRASLATASIDGGYELDRTAFANCAHMVFSSHWAAASAARDYGVDEHRISVQHFGPNLSHLLDRNELQAIIRQRGRGPCRLLFVAVDWVRKGGDLAMAIAEELRGRGLMVELEVVGCDPPRTTSGIVHRFGFLSKVDKDQEHRIEQLYAEADFLVLPTRADCSPIVLSEAALNGLPIATTAVGGVAEVVDCAEWGIALPPDAGAKGYADWLYEMYTDRARYRRAALLARDAYDAGLNWNAYCARIETIADRLLRERTLASLPA
jgi:glycosyltransferase involved in cell wall biosynthesis